jgi:hypothetical protein
MRSDAVFGSIPKDAFERVSGDHGSIDVRPIDSRMSQRAIGSPTNDPPLISYCLTQCNPLTSPHVVRTLGADSTHARPSRVPLKALNF